MYDCIIISTEVSVLQHILIIINCHTLQFYSITVLFGVGIYIYDCCLPSYRSLLQVANITPISNPLGVAGENLLQWRGQVRGGAVMAAAGIQAAPVQSAAHMHRRGTHLRYLCIARAQLTASREKTQCNPYIGCTRAFFQRIIPI